MSGSGGGRYTPPQRNEFDCETGEIISNASSINLTILAKHTVGARLKVVLGQKDEVILEDGDGEVLGSILHSNTADLIDCIKRGTKYQALIQRINGPICRVKILSIY